MRQRVVICWRGISGYLAACWRELAARSEVQLQLILAPSPSNANAPFGLDIVAGLPIEVLPAERMQDGAFVAARVASFEPDLVIVPGWYIPAFASLPFSSRLSDARFALAMDTPLSSKLRQSLARIKLRSLLSRVDRVLVAGERSWQYARFLGVPECRIRRGIYGFDGVAFGNTYERRVRRQDGWPKRLLYCGRYVDEKAIDVLVKGYSIYRREVADAWPLTTCGSGPLGDLVRATPGVSDCGFVQPAEQSALFEEHGAFVIASRYEPWGVAIAEAMYAGLPSVCTEACGASVELVRGGWNGVTVATDDEDDLARGLLWVHRNASQLALFGSRAHEAAAPFTATEWAARFVDVCRELQCGRR